MTWFTQLLHCLHALKRTPLARRKTNVRRAARVSLECLEGREVPSATGLVSATRTLGSRLLLGTAPQEGNSVVYSIDQQGSLWRHDTSVPRLASTPDWVKLNSSSSRTDLEGMVQISATNNEWGQPVVFGVNRRNEVWEFNPAFTGKLFIARAETADRGIAAITATQNQFSQPVVFITTGQGSLFEFDPGDNVALHNINIPQTPYGTGAVPAFTVSPRVNATQDGNGYPVLFVEALDSNPKDGLNYDHTIWSWSQFLVSGKNPVVAWARQSGPQTSAFKSLSATRGIDNQTVLFVLDGQGAVSVKNSLNSSASFVGLFGNVSAIDATRLSNGKASVFMVSQGRLEQFTLGDQTAITHSIPGVTFGGSPISLAVTQNSAGEAVVYVTDTFRQLFKFNTSLRTSRQLTQQSAPSIFDPSYKYFVFNPYPIL